MTVNFKKDEIYRYSNDDWWAIGIVLSANKKMIVFKDFVTNGKVDVLNRWDQPLPLSFKSPRYELLGTKVDFPEYFL